MKIQAIVLLAFASVASVSNAQDMATADGNGDGKVTVKEFAKYAGEKLSGFDQIDAFAKKVDADGNGEISEAEFADRQTALRAMVSGAADDQGSAEKSDGPHKVGDKASDFELQGLDEMVKLSSKVGSGKSAVVVFSRAHW